MIDREQRKLWSQFKVGDLYKIRDEKGTYYKQLFKVTRVNEIGIVCEDENESYGNRLSTKVKYMFGWPSISFYIGNGQMYKIDPDSVEAIPQHSFPRLKKTKVA